MQIIREKDPLILLDYFQFKSKYYGGKKQMYPNYFRKEAAELNEEEFEAMGVEDLKNEKSLQNSGKKRFAPVSNVEARREFLLNYKEAEEDDPEDICDENMIQEESSDDST